MLTVRQFSLAVKTFLQQDLKTYISTSKLRGTDSPRDIGLRGRKASNVTLEHTGLFKMIVGVLTTYDTQHTWDSSICVFYLIEQHSQVFVTYLTGALYVHPLWFYKHQHDNRVRSKLFVACQRWWFQCLFWFVPSVPGYLREEEEHKPNPWRNPIERNHMGLHLEKEVVKTPTIILNNPVQIAVNE